MYSWRRVQGDLEPLPMPKERWEGSWDEDRERWDEDRERWDKGKWLHTEKGQV